MRNASSRAAALAWLDRTLPALRALSAALGNGWEIVETPATDADPGDRPSFLIRLELADGVRACPLTAALPCPDAAAGCGPAMLARVHELPAPVVDTLIAAADGETGPVRDRMLALTGAPFDPATGPRFPTAEEAAR